MTTDSAPFDVPRDAAVVTTTYVTRDNMDVLYVTHEEDEDGSVIWQFHAGIGDYRPEVLQLVSLDEILRGDPALVAVAALPIGWSARRSSKSDEWKMEAEN